MNVKAGRSAVEDVTAKRLTRADASSALMKTIAMTLARRGLDAGAIRTRMATLAAVAAEQAIAWAAEERGPAMAATGDDLELAASAAIGKVVSP